MFADADMDPAPLVVSNIEPLKEPLLLNCIDPVGPPGVPPLPPYTHPDMLKLLLLP
jgi:hypothetical protein